MDDLVGRLKNIAMMKTTTDVGQICGEAAAAIEELVADKEILSNGFKTSLNFMLETDAKLMCAEKELDRVKAERDAAVADLLNACDHPNILNRKNISRKWRNPTEDFKRRLS